MLKSSADIDALWDYNNPAATEQKFRAALTEAAAANDQALQLELLTQIARTQGLQQKFDDAHATLDRVQSKLTEADAHVHVRYLLERGRVLNSSKQAGKATRLFIEAMNRAAAHKLDFYAIDAMHMIAIAESDPAKQLEWNERAVKLAEASSDERARGWLASLYNNIGWTYYEQKRFDEALAMFTKAIPLRERAGKPIPLRIAHYSVGKTLRAMGRIDEALILQLAQLEDAQRHNQPDGFICEEIGECLLAQGKVGESQNHFKRAFDLLRKDAWLKRDEPERIARIERLANAVP